MADTFADGFDRLVPTLLEFGPKAEALLGTLIQASGLDVHAVTHRVKTRESALRKADAATPPLAVIDDLHDFLGLRVITYFADDVDKVAAIVEREFHHDPARTKDKRASIDPDRFGYLSVHYGARLSRNRRRLAEWASYSNIHFEIQIRSVLQHAWAEIEHDLGYKSTAGSVPAEFRRRFSRLAGMLEVADEQFAVLRDDLSHYERAVNDTRSIVNDLDINQVTVASFIDSNPVVRRADEAIATGHGTKLVPSDTTYARVRAEEMIRLGAVSIRDVEKLLVQYEELITRVAVAWLDDASTDEFDRGQRDENGHYRELPRGISLFYLSRHLDKEHDRTFTHGDEFRAVDDRVVSEMRREASATQQTRS